MKLSFSLYSISNKHWWWFGFIFLILLSIGFAFCLASGIDWVFPLEIKQQLWPVEVGVAQLEIGVFSMPLLGQSYLITEYFQPAGYIYPYWQSLLGLICVFVGLSGFLASTVSISGLRYYLYLGLFAGIIVLLHPDCLATNPTYGSVIMVIFIVLPGILSWFFAGFRPNDSILFRFVCFLALWAVLIGVCLWRSDVPFPLQALAANGQQAYILLALSFMVFTCAQIPAFLLAASTISPSKPGSLLNFMAAMLIYLLNLLVVFYDDTSLIKSTILYVPLFAWLPLSVLAGFFLLSIKNLKQSDKFEQTSIVFYLSLSLMGIVSVCMAWLTGSDALQKFYYQSFLYLYLGGAGAFLIYVFVNFSSVLAAGKAVWKVMYIPLYLPFGSHYALAITVFFIMFLGNDMGALRQVDAARYNSLAAYHYLCGQNQLAERSWRQTLDNRPLDFQAQYALALLAHNQGFSSQATSFLDNAVYFSKNNPGPSLLYARILARQDRPLEALLMLHKGLENTPNSVPLFNALAISYSTTQLKDSSFFYLNRAITQNKYQDLLVSNRLAIEILAGKQPLLSSLKLENNASIAYKTNILAAYALQDMPLAQISKKDLPNWLPAPNDSLDDLQISLLNNYLTYQTVRHDTLGLSRAKQLRQLEPNKIYSESLQNVCALMLFAGGQQPVAALEKMAALAYQSGFNKSEYAKNAAQIALSLGRFHTCLDYCAQVQNDAQLDFASALSYAFLGNEPMARQIIAEKQLLKNGEFKDAAQILDQALNPIVSDTQPDPVRYTALLIKAQQRPYSNYYPAFGQPSSIILPIDPIISKSLRQIESAYFSQKTALFLAQESLLHGQYRQTRNWLANTRTDTSALGRQAQLYSLQLDILTQNPQNTPSQILSEQQKIWQLCQPQDNLTNAFFELYFQSETQKIPALIDKLKAVALADPLFLSLAIYKLHKINQPQAAYDLSLEALNLMPQEPFALMAYIRQAEQNNLSSFTSSARNKLQTLIPAADYKLFLAD